MTKVVSGMAMMLAADAVKAGAMEMEQGDRDQRQFDRQARSRSAPPSAAQQARRQPFLAPR